ncbi:MAG: transcriptional regulator [Rhodobacteraceae bacterium CG17_big_fil_post_rev_8_21_14_2_50_63_15]|nr:LysR family transcriptional regulator [Roseovarius sp.]PIV77763.1 MAG: transcriptional regulator [Rhodobacteraceae bacterium CG17_big_fil_post_rev_8_21_14_2_50_63_15]
MRIPSTQALRALVSFARHGSVWQAADELNLTRSAVSHQLRMLERDLDFHMLNRVGTRVELTAQGRAYAEDVRQALLAISGSAARNTGRGVAGRLTVSCAPGFASSWLCNKIARFTSAYPDVALSIITPRRLGEVTNPDVDLFITYGNGEFADMQSEHILDVVSSPVCSPAMVNRLGGMPEPRDALRLGLLHLLNHEDWALWFSSVGLDPSLAARGVVFSDMHLVYAAALAGQGIAMGDVILSQGALSSGKLVRPFEHEVRAPRAYYMAVPLAIAENPTVMAFRSWLRAELDQGFALPLGGAGNR